MWQALDWVYSTFTYMDPLVVLDLHPEYLSTYIRPINYVQCTIVYGKLVLQTCPARTGRERRMRCGGPVRFTACVIHVMLYKPLIPRG